MRRELVYLSSIGADCCEAARAFGLGIELAQFCTAARLDGAPPEPWELPVECCLSASSRFVLHGPFNELTPAAIDPLVLDVTKKRYRQAIKKAHTLGIQKIVLHAGFLPLVYYPEWFVERSAAVWRELLCDVPDDMTVCLENVLEPEPQLLTAIMEAVHDPRLRICSISATRIRARQRFPRRTGCAPVRRTFPTCTCTTIRATVTCTRRSLTA